MLSVHGGACSFPCLRTAALRTCVGGGAVGWRSGGNACHALHAFIDCLASIELFATISWRSWVVLWLDGWFIMVCLHAMFCWWPLVGGSRRFFGVDDTHLIYYLFDPLSINHKIYLNDTTICSKWYYMKVSGNRFCLSDTFIPRHSYWSQIGPLPSLGLIWQSSGWVSYQKLIK